jgi:uncharacterized protein
LAKQAFYDPNAVFLPDEKHSQDENRMKVIGATRQRLLVVIYLEKRDDLIRIISAWEAGRRDKRLYYEN